MRSQRPVEPAISRMVPSSGADVELPFQQNMPCPPSPGAAYPSTIATVPFGGGVHTVRHGPGAVGLGTMVSNQMTEPLSACATVAVDSPAPWCPRPPAPSAELEHAASPNAP